MDGQSLVRVTTEQREEGSSEEESTVDNDQVERFEQDQALVMNTAVAANVEVQSEAEQDTLHIVEEYDSKENADHNGETSASHQIDSSRLEDAENQQDQSVVPTAEIQPQ